MFDLTEEAVVRDNPKWHSLFTRDDLGKTVFTPIYRALSARGVKFKFFHCVESLHPSGDKLEIERIDIWQQAHCKQGEYQPLVRVNAADSNSHSPGNS